MSTLEEFENAPGGATATNEYGLRAIKLNHWGRWRSQTGAMWDSGDMERYGYTLDPSPAPTTAREALALAWNLAHPVKEGHEIPKGTELISQVRDGEFLTYRSEKPFDGVRRQGWAEARTLDPLPEPEPDWLDAPAVLAATIFEDRSENRTVFVRENKDGTQWVRDTRFYRWDELIDVVPLYPKGQDA